MNLYFDLWEVRRRELDENLKNYKNQPFLVTKIYREFITQSELKDEEYFKTIKYGKNKAKMTTFNDSVKQKLGINNMELFDCLKPE